MNRKIHKIAIYYVLAVLSLTLVWIALLYTVILPNFFVTTEAKVIELRMQYPMTRRGGRQTNQLPVYEYIDDKGQIRRYESHDGFNSMNGFLLKKEVGQTVKAYYEKGAKEGLLVTNTGDWYTFLFAPIIFALFPVGLVFLIVSYFLRRTKR